MKKDKKKSSWQYQKNKYKQINIKFNMSDDYDAMLHWYLTTKTANASRLIKDLIYNHIAEEAYLEP